jgi:hypothetical protein
VYTIYIVLIPTQPEPEMECRDNSFQTSGGRLQIICSVRKITRYISGLLLQFNQSTSRNSPEEGKMRTQVERFDKSNQTLSSKYQHQNWGAYSRALRFQILTIHLRYNNRKGKFRLRFGTVGCVCVWRERELKYNPEIRRNTLYVTFLSEISKNFCYN